MAAPIRTPSVHTTADGGALAAHIASRPVQVGARTLVATAKNEGPFLLEWVLYHRMIGFNNIVLFANDCEDGSDHLLQLMSQAGLIRYFDNSQELEGMPGDPQNRAYRRAHQMDHVAGSDWILVIDMDEFFNIHTGDGTLDALFAATGSADMISAPWLVYGNSGKIDYEEGLVTEQFTRCAPKDTQVSFRHFGLKTMFRPGPVHRFGIHRPFLKGEFKRPEVPLRWLNGSGQDVNQHYRTKGWSASMQTVGYSLCQVNHYMTKSNALFLMKRYRGTANSVDADRINYEYYDSFNSNHDVDVTMHRWSDRIRKAKAALCAKHLEIGAAHDACVGFFHDKIAALTDGLQDADPETWDKLMNPETVAASVARDEKWLMYARRREAAKKRQEKLDYARKLAEGAPVTEDKTPEDKFTSEPLGKSIHKDDVAPKWLADLRRSQNRRGFYYSDTGFAAHFAERNTDTVIVSFDNLSSVNDPSLARESWGYGFYKSEGWSHLGVMSFAANWCRDEGLFDYLTGLAASGFFKKFGKVVMTGTSMGAYAATAFASLVPGATVLAFSPQSTLDERLVPWEDRFAKGRAQNWNGRFRDAAAEIGDAKKVFIFYDPAFEPDRLHAQRYQGDNVQYLKTWFSGHKSALFLRRAELLKPLVKAGVSGELDPELFYAAYRGRRKLPWYINALGDMALERGHRKLVKRMARALKREGRGKLGEAVLRRAKA